jgi:hypothetical protein
MGAMGLACSFANGRLAAKMGSRVFHPAAVIAAISKPSIPGDASQQRWPWWPLLPLYPYGRRRSLVRELIPGQVWGVEQLLGVFYVAVPIRMTVLRLRQGLLLYAPVAPTAELRAALAELEQLHGPVVTIVLPTSSGLEHKLPVPAMARAFPKAQVWVTPGQWSFPLPLPLSWLGFPAQRTKVLFEQGLPHADQLDWCALGPLDLGLGSFFEAACLHRASSSLLVTDALVAIGEQPPSIFDADPKPLLFHARERADQPLLDSPDLRRKGWWRLVLFASFLRPEQLALSGLGELLQQAWSASQQPGGAANALYPFRWQANWQAEFRQLVPAGEPLIQVAPVLERLVFPRHRGLLINWLQQLAQLGEIRHLVPAHYEAPVPCTAEDLQDLAKRLSLRPWAVDEHSWRYLASIDRNLLKLGVVPNRGH